MNKELSRALMVLGLLLALGMSAAAFIFGTQAKNIGAGRQSISVKGLAEKPIKADIAEWRIGIKVIEPSFAQALEKLRKTRPALEQFLTKNGIDLSTVVNGNESVEPNMTNEEGEDGRTRFVQKGYAASQSITVSSKDLAKIAAIHKAALQLEADGLPVFYSSPQYLLSNLEEVKMSLIGAATKNASQRASEFAKNGGVQVGAMRSASQGAFYILPIGASMDSEDYGGTYDKTTVDKIARVVVTIEYNIEK